MQVRTAVRRPLLLLTLLCALLYLPGLASLPPFDRDEARFAQASKQVLQEGRWLVPYFQDEPRSKKPAGIYWLQAGSVAGAQVFTGDTAVRREIWAYRVPSVLGAWLAVLLTYAVGVQLFDRLAAFTGAALLGSSLLLTVEAHLAKTDAVLLATILLALWGLARAQALWRAGEIPASGKPRPWLPFWGGLGLSVLIKGPIGPAVVGLAALGQRWAAGSWRWGRHLQPLPGVLVFAVLAGAWPAALLATGAGGFLVESANEDLIPKLLSAQESHGAPPGSYLLALYLAFWPGVLLGVPGLVAAFRRRSHSGVRFCLAWLVPGWILFALVPTKLPHYVLPFYPALGLLAGHLASVGWPEVRSRVWPWLGWLHAGLCPLVGLGLAAAFVGVPAHYGGGVGNTAVVPTVLALVAVAVLAETLLRLRALPQPGLVVFAAVLVWPVLAQVYVPRLEPLFPARTVARTLPPPEARGALAATGYTEPSLVFLNGTGTRITGPDGVAAHLARTPDGYGLVAARERTRFDRALAERGVRVREVRTFRAFNYSKGERLRLTLFAGREGGGG
jgi:4-amino-4-deoxy-L-arabinose transferase-like glycosyltransferase